MDDFNQAPPPPEQQLTHEDLAKLAIQRVTTLAIEALEHPNSTTMNERAETVKSWVTPILDQNDYKTAELEVNHRGLNDRPHSGGISVKRRYNPSGGGETYVEEYWIDTRDQKLYKLYPNAGSLKDSDRFSRCHSVETKEVMDEYGDIIESAIHPEKVASRKKLDELAAQTVGRSKQRGGFLMRLFRKKRS